MEGARLIKFLPGGAPDIHINFGELPWLPETQNEPKGVAKTASQSLQIRSTRKQLEGCFDFYTDNGIWISNNNRLCVIYIIRQESY